MPEPENLFFWQAYMELRVSRNVGFGFGAIPFSEIMTYADHCGITCPVQRARLVSMIGAMDAAEREVHAQKAKRSKR